MEHFYDAQIKRYLTQFMRLMSNFAYKDARGNIVQIPVRYGDMNRQVAQIMKKNSENVIQSAPFVACYIKTMDLARDRVQDPTFVSKVNIRERAYDATGQEYLNTQGANYTVERLMPTPYNLEFAADIWTTNTDQKFQWLEQVLVLFNPSMEIQSNSNFIDWTSLTVVELKSMNFSSRSVPQGLEQDIDIATLTFTTPIWLTTPAKVKKLGIITKIITNVFDDAAGQNELTTYPNSENIDYFSGRTPMSVNVTTLGNLGLMVLNNTAQLVLPENSKAGGSTADLNPPQKFGADVNWVSILDAYPGKFTAGLSQIRLTKPDGNEIVGYITLNPSDERIMQVNFDHDTIPYDTLLTDAGGLNPRGTIDAIVNPETFNPRPMLPNGALDWAATDSRYLVLEDITSTIADGPVAWNNNNGTDFMAHANDIVQWDGVQWNIIFTSQSTTELTYITNSRTGVQYAWDGVSWMKSFEGIYDPGKWRLVL